jgi:hypothetical protein
MNQRQNNLQANGARGGRSCAVPEVEQSLHGERGDTGRDDGKG